MCIPTKRDSDKDNPKDDVANAPEGASPVSAPDANVTQTNTAETEETKSSVALMPAPVPKESCIVSPEKPSSSTMNTPTSTDTPPEVVSKTMKTKRRTRIVPGKKVPEDGLKSREAVHLWVHRTLNTGVDGLIAEFRPLNKYTIPGMTTIACSANKSKNRYNDVSCQDQRRVKLTALDAPCDYIHANFVGTPVSASRFICTQGPLDSTNWDFWAMIIQEKVEIILMLCNVKENNRIKCSQYWPIEPGQFMVFGAGLTQLRITTTAVTRLEQEEAIRVSDIKVEWYTNKLMTLNVKHYHWQNWPDRGVPPGKLTPLILFSQVRSTTRPILIHCSAGIGRTGTIAAIAFVQERMMKGQSCENMQQLLKELRSHRSWMIQNEMQYLYVHRVLLAYFLEKYGNRFPECLNNGFDLKYKKFCEDYKALTGCD